MGSGHSGSGNLDLKTPGVRQVIVEMIGVLKDVGLPLGGTSRRTERTAQAVLALADVRDSGGWHRAGSVEERALGTREVIAWLNEHMDEEISSGSYDDIRRKDLEHPVLAGLVVNSDPDTARNNPTRGYGLSTEFRDLIRTLGTERYESQLSIWQERQPNLAKELAGSRELPRFKVDLPGGETVGLGPGQHNQLISAVIDEFLPRFGHESEVLYVGDSSNRLLFHNEKRLIEVGMFELGAGELPDVVAFSPELNWLFLIEAVHSTGPISPERQMKLNRLLAESSTGVIFVTAFESRLGFRRFVAEIAWETEVWIAEEPDHLIHFNGDRFLGPH